MSLLVKKIIHLNLANRNFCGTQFLFISQRKLNIVASVYDGEKNPAPKFFSYDVQTLLKRLTRPDHAKVFRKRTSKGHTVLRTPQYKFLTNEELQREIEKAQKKANQLLQMPPVVMVQKPVDDILSEEPALTGHDTSKYIFTDITFGVPNEHRIIIERNLDGVLRSCDHDVRKRMNQIYFPILGRKIREPYMFTDEDKLNSLLDRQKYEFVLDRACLQYEPDEPTYQRVTSITYQHIDANRNYDLLRSTRHFGPLVFYLTWHDNVDGLMLELLQTGAVREAVLLADVRRAILADVKAVDQKLIQEILATPIQLAKPESLSEEDINLDTKCMECVEKYITEHSAMKGQQELALQGFREGYQNLIELSRGVRKAHGNA